MNTTMSTQDQQHTPADRASISSITHSTLDTSFTIEEAYRHLHNPESVFYEKLSGAKRIEIAAAIDSQTQNGEFTPATPTKYATPLETINSVDLAVLSPSGRLYKLGDKVNFETSRPRRSWSSSTNDVEYERCIDRLSRNFLSVPSWPTYSNTPTDSPSTSYDTEITVIKRSSLEPYRERLDPSVTDSIDTLKDTVNGWELDTIEYADSDLECTTSNIVKEITWTHPIATQTQISATWRFGYRCWYLSTPTETGTVSEANKDRYMYEVDVPQRVVSTEDIISLATDYMRAIPPEYIQDAYDLRDPEQTGSPDEHRDGFIPIEIPDKIGPWKLVKRERGTITYRAESPPSTKWNGFIIKISKRGGFRVVYNPDEDTREHHDGRAVERYYPNGTACPNNINTSINYGCRKRDMFDDNWYYPFGFMVQTAQNPNKTTVNQIEKQTPTDIDITQINTEVNMNPHDTKRGELSLSDF